MFYKLLDSFPDPGFFYKVIWGASGPQAQSYTLEQLISECDQLMEDALEIANAVGKDMKKWSENKRFVVDGCSSPLQNGELLVAQPGWSSKPDSSPWLYRGFFDLPRTYRMISI